ncbi:MAG: phosphoenolpyruvate synthase, partial [Myxococcales bacterium]|nr:phosphoenolpyruvate synthase [Myxococcales bacterium]
AIRTIRDSAHSAAARAYRQRLGIVGEPATGVVIQKLILADCAGVLFSRDPISNRDERVIEAAWGLGEAVVSGLVNPDRYRLSRDGALIERTAGEKDLMIRWLDESGTEEQSVEPALVHAFCLDEQKLSRLHELANRCEHVFGGPQDLEWAFADDQLFLLQRRAITGRHG